LSEALPRYTALFQLNLSENGFGTEGARALSEALPHCATLSHLNLADNFIAHEAVCALSKALPGPGCVLYL